MLSRRTLLRQFGAASLGAAGVVLVGCGAREQAAGAGEDRGPRSWSITSRSAGEVARFGFSGMMSVYGADEIETYVAGLSGVEAVRVSFFSNEAWVAYEPAIVTPEDIVAAVNARADDWPFSRWWLAAPASQDPATSFPAFRSPGAHAVEQVRETVAPPPDALTPAGFRLSLDQAADFIRYNDRTGRLTSPQRKTIRNGLDFTLVCCPPFEAWRG